jgi:3'(2'), 5'-bisphosphate nucleotidase
MIDDLLQIARAAGAIIFTHYGKPIPAEKKADDSPLTLADRASHAHVVEALGRLTPDIPIISEEGELPPPAERTAWTRFWLVDPLDGTKEFIKQTGEFTVNIGLIEDGVPTVGVVFAPATGLMYWATGGQAWKQLGDADPTPIASGTYHEGDAPTFVASRDHAGPAVRELADRHPNAAFRSMGSSLKFCLVAEGAADVYLRDVPTMEWDTAAAHAIVRAAGSTLRQLDGEALAYNKPDLRNPALVTYRAGADQLLG